MRTTIDLPDELYRTLKTRAAVSGVTLRELVQRLIEQGLSEAGPRVATGERSDPPIIIPATGRKISVTPEDIHRLEEEDDLERHARSLGR